MDDQIKKLTIKQIKNIQEYKRIIKHIKKYNKYERMTKKQIYNLLVFLSDIHDENELIFFFKNMYTKTCSLEQQVFIPKKFIRIIMPTKRLYHGRNVHNTTKRWDGSKNLHQIMWWALERTTPLVYAKTAFNNNERHRWDVYEARLKHATPFLIISKQSIEYLLSIPKLKNLKCEGKTVGAWIKGAFPIIRGELKRRSYIESDRNMAICLCKSIGCYGYVANEIPVANAKGSLHKEILICDPPQQIKLYKFISFKTKKGKENVQRYLNERTTKLTPDISFIY